MPYTFERHLLTGSWTTKVDAIESAVNSSAQPEHGEDGHVVFAEVPQDGLLHVTVVRKHEAWAITPWSGSVSSPGGARYVRTFGDAKISDIAKSIGEQLGTRAISK